jgi:hypothetical protein
MSEIVILRANILGGMNEYITTRGDEDIIENWLQVFPDGADEDDLMEIAEDESLWLEVIQCFARCCRSMGII